MRGRRGTVEPQRRDARQPLAQEVVIDGDRRLHGRPLDDVDARPWRGQRLAEEERAVGQEALAAEEVQGGKSGTHRPTLPGPRSSVRQTAVADDQEVDTSTRQAAKKRVTPEARNRAAKGR